MQELKHIRDKCKVGYEMYPLYFKITNMLLFLEGKEKNKNILVNYDSIDNVTVLIKLKNCLKTIPQFWEELEKINHELDNRQKQLKKYVKYCQTIKNGPIEEKYYSHILKELKEIENYN